MDETTHPVAAARPHVLTPLKLELLKQRRTQKWLASRVGTDSAQISDYCRGVHVPKPSTRAAIASALGRHENELFGPEAVTEAAAFGSRLDTMSDDDVDVLARLAQDAA